MNSTVEVPTAREVIDQERRVHRILRARFADALLEMGVSFAQLEVMELLHDVEAIRARSVGGSSSPGSPRRIWCVNSKRATTSRCGRSTEARTVSG